MVTVQREKNKIDTTNELTSKRKENARIQKNIKVYTSNEMKVETKRDSKIRPRGSKDKKDENKNKGMNDVNKKRPSRNKEE